MSEPVGNASRTREDVPSNSHKSREATQKPPRAEIPRPEKVIVGQVVTKKAPWYRRFLQNLVAEDAHTLGDHFMQEIFYPTLRRVIVESGESSLNRVFYGTARRHRGVVGERPSLRTRYDQMSSPVEARKSLSPAERARHDFGNIILETRGEVVDVLESMMNWVDQYGMVSVADMYDFLGETCGPADRNWGWTDLSTADVRHVRGGFALDLPRPISLR